jgi:hypothetical protein
LAAQELEKEVPKGKVLDESATVVTLTAEELAQLRQVIICKIVCFSTSVLARICCSSA